ncbi:MAG TPA: tetratricopeptide repeat protein [Oxalicibacterium sp.]
MSVINKMLQELEQRHAEESGARVLPGQLKAAPQVRSRHAGWLAAAVLAVLLAGVLAWLWLRPAAVPVSAPAVVSAKPADAPRTPTQLAVKIASAMPMEEQQAAGIQEAAVAEEAPALPTEDVQQAKVEKTESKPIDRAEPVAVSAASVVPQETVGTAAAKVVEKPARLQPVRAEAAKSAASTQVTVAKPVAPQPVSTQPAVSDTPVALDKQVRRLTPQQRAENDYRRAAAMAERGRAAEATALLEHVLQEVPVHIGARQTLIALLLRAGQQDEAMRCAKEGLDIDMRQPGLAMILARLQVEKGAQQTAIATLQNSLPHAADQPDYRAFLAALLQRAGRQKEAVEQYLLAVRAVPQNGIWWMGLGISLQADGRMEEARQAFSRSRETSSLSPELRAFVEQKLKQLH